jgi:hypothetical protein
MCHTLNISNQKHLPGLEPWISLYCVLYSRMLINYFLSKSSPALVLSACVSVLSHSEL